MMAAAPTTSAPAPRATSMVSRVDPPVVTTSSTTSTRSPGAIVKPRRSVSARSCRSTKMARTPSARATSCPMTIPPIAGDSTSPTPRCRRRSARATPQASASAGMLQDQGALQIPGAVQAGRQPEVTVEQRPDTSKSLQNCVDGDRSHRGRVYLLHNQNIDPPRFVYRREITASGARGRETARPGARLPQEARRSRFPAETSGSALQGRTDF